MLESLGREDSVDAQQLSVGGASSGSPRCLARRAHAYPQVLELLRESLPRARTHN
jgi:hypothetical protein